MPEGVVIALISSAALVFVTAFQERGRRRDATSAEEARKDERAREADRLETQQRHELKLRQADQEEEQRLADAAAREDEREAARAEAVSQFLQASHIVLGALRRGAAPRDVDWTDLTRALGVLHGHASLLREAGHGDSVVDALTQAGVVGQGNTRDRLLEGAALQLEVLAHD